jgi:hypothetical protein
MLADVLFLPPTDVQTLCLLTMKIQPAHLDIWRCLGTLSPDLTEPRTYHAR